MELSVPDGGLFVAAAAAAAAAATVVDGVARCCVASPSGTLIAGDGVCSP